MELQDEVLDVARAASRLGVSPDAVRKRIRRGTLRAHKVDGAWRVVVPAIPPVVSSSGLVTRQDSGLDAVRDTMIEHLIRENERLTRAIAEQAAAVTELSRRVAQLAAGPVAEVPETEPPPGAPITTPTAGYYDEHGALRRRPWWVRWLRGKE